MRGTSRGPEGLEAIEGAGIESALADPDRPGTVLELCGDVAVVVWLLGSAHGAVEAISAIHGPRLERLLEKLVESPVRGFAYECEGTVDRRVLADGRRIAERVGERWRIRIALLSEDRADAGWATRTAASVAGLLAG